jgi:hypothetical protein
MIRSLSVQRALAICLATVPVAPSARADDAARIGRLETEIQQLRSQIDEQNRRIQRLEAELARAAGAQADAPRPRPRTPGTQAGAAPASGPQPWHAAAAWERVKPGMTEAEAVAILGPPSAADSIGALKSLFYRDAPGRADLHGHVNLKDGRVVAVNKPAF